jgi:hypothetical protein
MARERLTFRERDVSAAIRAVEKTGHKVARVEIGPDGRIIVELASPVGNGQPTTPLDEWLKKHAHATEGDQ